MAVVGGGNITAMDPPIAEQTRSLDNEPSSDPHHLLLVGLGFGGNSPPRTSVSGLKHCLLFEAPPHQIDSRQCRIEERPVGIKLIVVAAEELIPARSWWICVDLFAEGVRWMACSGEHLKPKHARKRGRNEEEGK
ncbi:hypothetical protein OsI_38378 [Oryza sativa Indica Group]|uniref:Uncharacterized protein n=2 Tax=Oryza TaxID=4527 RepID=A0A0E0JAG8_ORYNI|nr:hypothetical protein OsI_38378 [Oryza sativa Indica Group]